MPAAQTSTASRPSRSCPAPQTDELTAQQRHDDLLDLADVLGKRVDRHAAAAHRDHPRGERASRRWR